VFTSIYGSHLTNALSGQTLPADALEQAKDSVGAALRAAAAIGGNTGNEIGAAARSAFIDGFHAALRVGALVTIIGVVITLVWLPARARPSDVDSQAEEFEAEHPELQPDRVTSSHRAEPGDHTS
jgi:DHA2 family multidrug resistance protein-like MFS transporter